MAPEQEEAPPLDTASASGMSSLAADDLFDNPDHAFEQADAGHAVEVPA